MLGNVFSGQLGLWEYFTSNHVGNLVFLGCVGSALDDWVSGRVTKTGISSKSSCGCNSCCSWAVYCAKLVSLGLLVPPSITAHLIPIIDFVYNTWFYLLSFSLILTLRETTGTVPSFSKLIICVYCSVRNEFLKYQADRYLYAPKNSEAMVT